MQQIRFLANSVAYIIFFGKFPENIPVRKSRLYTAFTLYTFCRRKYTYWFADAETINSQQLL